MERFNPVKFVEKSSKVVIRNILIFKWMMLLFWWHFIKRNKLEAFIVNDFVSSLECILTGRFWGQVWTKA